MNNPFILHRPSPWTWTGRGIAVLLLAVLMVSLSPQISSAAPKIVSVRSELMREPAVFWEKVRGPLRANEINKFDDELTLAEGEFEPSHNFRVRWNGAEMAGSPLELRLVYRQKAAQQPATLKLLTDKPGRRNNETLFRIRGEQFDQFGPVNAWRVEIWSGNQLLTQKLGPLQNLLLTPDPAATEVKPAP